MKIIHLISGTDLEKSGKTISVKTANPDSLASILKFPFVDFFFENKRSINIQFEFPYELTIFFSENSGKEVASFQNITSISRFFLGKMSK